jgi:alkaline phosphatase
MIRTKKALLRWAAVTALAASGAAYGQPNLSIMLPERTRLLQDQRIDVIVELRNPGAGSSFKITANGRDITSQFQAPAQVDLDCNGTPDTVYRANLIGFNDVGNVRIIATVTGGGQNLEAIKDIQVRQFSVPAKGRNVVLFIGDAMGTAYRDAARIVSRSVETIPGVRGFREGFFDKLLEMDRMPVSGMSMTYASDRVIPDSANTATAWATGNKTFEGALGVFADGTDCVWRAAANSSTLNAALDNPRVETLWEYLKRKYQYRTGIVSTAFITDATPAGQGAHTASRQYTFEVARQYFENPMLNNQPGFDLILGGGKEDFDADIRLDGRDLVKEFQAKGYKLVSTATDLKAVAGTDAKVLGLFRRPNTVARASTGIRPTANGNMDVAYDKLGLARPSSEPPPAFGDWKDQPFLDLMTQKAMEVLGGPDGNQPFILMVEGASIDKQSHPNHAAGTIWDVIELDKAIGVARTWAQKRSTSDTLIVVTADHDQSMSIIGTNVIDDADLTDHASVLNVTVTSPMGDQKTQVSKDAASNVRASYGYYNSGGDPNTTGIEGVTGMTYQNISREGFPDYIDQNNDGYPENRRVGDKGTLRISVGFRTGNHTGSSVPVTAEGPGAFLFTGYMDQADIAFKIAASLTGDTADGDAFVKNVLLNPKYPVTYGK